MDYAVPVGLVILVAILALLIAAWGWPALMERLKRRHPRVTRKFLFAVKWVRSYLGNLLWLLGGTPLWIALGGAALAWVSYIFYNLPFLSKTRNR